MAIVSMLAALPLMLQSGDPQMGPMDMGDDCAFLVRAFEGTYRGIREEEGRLENADTDKIMMYLSIQSNTLQLAEAAGCDVRPMIRIARKQLSRYEERGRKSQQD